jgi:hypothetical protein
VAAAIAAWLNVDARVVTVDVLPGSVIVRACINADGYDGELLALSLLGAFNRGALSAISGYAVASVSIQQPATALPTFAPTTVPVAPGEAAMYTFPPTGAGDCSGVVEVQTTAGMRAHLHTRACVCARVCESARVCVRAHARAPQTL